MANIIVKSTEGNTHKINIKDVFVVGVRNGNKILDLSIKLNKEEF